MATATQTPLVCTCPGSGNKSLPNTKKQAPTKSNVPPPATGPVQATNNAPSLMNSTAQPDDELQQLTNVLCYIVGFVAYSVMGMMVIWATGFHYTRRYIIMFNNTKRSTQIILMIVGSVFLLWILVHALLLTPSHQQDIKPCVKGERKDTAVKAKALMTDKPPKDTGKGTSIVPKKFSNKCVNTMRTRAKTVKVGKNENINSNDQSKSILQRICALLHSNPLTAQSKKHKSVGTQMNKQKQNSKGMPCKGSPATGTGMKAHSKQSPTCGGTRNIRMCGGESSSSTSKRTSQLKSTKQHPSKVNPQPGGEEAKCINHQSKGICDVLATQHDPKKQCLNQIQISEDEGRQIFKRHKWYATILEMKEPPAILVYLKDYITNYMESQ